MTRWNLAWLLSLSSAALLGLSLTYSAPARDTSLQSKHENLKLLVDVLEEVQHKYVKELDADKMRELVENMINSGLEKLDAHSNFYNADEYKQFTKQSRGKFGGIGIRIEMEAGQIFVQSPMVGTPAYDAGIMAGDLILKVDGKATENMALKKIVDTIQGEPGTKVTLTVLHEGSKTPVDIDINRAEIKIDSVLGDRRVKNNLKEWDFWIDGDSKIAYVRIDGFTETTTAEITRVVDALQKAGMKGLVLDLRNNPGGLLRSAVEVASLFLPEGKPVVTTKGRGGAKEDAYSAHHDNANMKPGTYYPIAILINRYSASASEIVAAALQDHLRAVIIGERSYGKGSVQNIIAMEGGISALKLTTASYWRPSGRNIHRFPDATEKDEWGVKPNEGYEVKLSDEERKEYFKWRRERDIIRRPGEEPVKHTASDRKSDKKTDGTKGKEPSPISPPPPARSGDQPDDAAKKKEPFRDRVLDKALDYIKSEVKKEKKEARVPGQPARDTAVAKKTLEAASVSKIIGWHALRYSEGRGHSAVHALRSTSERATQPQHG
jgi:carboxyl-terminal processing protease